jgi:hypothetical protein
MPNRYARRLRNELRYWRGRRLARSVELPAGARKIFIVGTGRSGTHWLGYALHAHPEIFADIEQNPVFAWATAMALDPRLEPKLLPHVIARYRAYHIAALPRHYCDKSHPNLWLAEPLARAFPEACFIALRRRLEPTVASMLRHRGVQFWAEHWRRYPVPNRFLGITEQNAELYARMTPAERSALRVIAHSRETDRLRHTLGARVYTVDYEALIRAPEVEADRLQRFLGLKAPIVLPIPIEASASQWRVHLSHEDKARIAAVARALGAEDLLAPPE